MHEFFRVASIFSPLSEYPIVFPKFPLFSDFWALFLQFRHCIDSLEFLFCAHTYINFLCSFDKMKWNLNRFFFSIKIMKLCDLLHNKNLQVSLVRAMLMRRWLTRFCQKCLVRCVGQTHTHTHTGSRCVTTNTSASSLSFVHFYVPCHNVPLSIFIPIPMLLFSINLPQIFPNFPNSMIFSVNVFLPNDERNEILGTIE